MTTPLEWADEKGIWRLFCADEGPVSEPFVVDEYKYATDGAICLRIASRDQANTLDKHGATTMEWHRRGASMKFALPTPGSYRRRCPVCGEDIWSAYPEYVRVHGQSFATKYLILINSLPGPLSWIKHGDENPESCEPRLFIFLYGKVMLMPCNENAIAAGGLALWGEENRDTEAVPDPCSLKPEATATEGSGKP